MSGRNERDLGKERFWRQMLRRWQNSGRTIRDFCASNRLSEQNFYAWRRTIAARDQQTMAQPRDGEQPAPSNASDDGPTFVPIRVVATTAALEVVLRDGRVVRVPADFDATALRQLLAVLDEVPSC